MYLLRIEGYSMLSPKHPELVHNVVAIQKVLLEPKSYIQFQKTKSSLFDKGRLFEWKFGFQGKGFSSFHINSWKI